MSRFKRRLSNETLHTFEWTHLWSIVTPIARDAPAQVLKDRNFILFLCRIERAVISGSLNDMEQACTGLYLSSMQHVTHYGFKKWW